MKTSRTFSKSKRIDITRGFDCNEATAVDMNHSEMDVDNSIEDTKVDILNGTEVDDEVDVIITEGRNAEIEKNTENQDVDGEETELDTEEEDKSSDGVDMSDNIDKDDEGVDEDEIGNGKEQARKTQSKKKKDSNEKRSANSESNEEKTDIVYNPISEWEEPIEVPSLTLFDMHRRPRAVNYDPCKRVALSLKVRGHVKKLL